MTHADHLTTMMAANNKQDPRAAAGWVRWLRAGGQFGEWAENTWSDIQFASQVLRLSKSETVLNLSCGWGRHAIALAHYGINVIGVDPSADLLELARETSSQAGVQVTWLQGELDDVQLTTPVDAVVQFNDNLLAWAQDPAEALFMLDQIHSLLKDGGRILFGTPLWEATPPPQAQSLAETPEATETYRRFFDPDSRIIQSQTVILGRDGQRREYWRHAWHPTAEQMAALLYQADFEIEGQFNDFSYLPYNPDQLGLVWLAHRE